MRGEERERFGKGNCCGEESLRKSLQNIEPIVSL